MTRTADENFDRGLEIQAALRNACQAPRDPSVLHASCRPFGTRLVKAWRLKTLLGRFEPDRGGEVPVVFRPVDAAILDTGLYAEGV